MTSWLSTRTIPLHDDGQAEISPVLEKDAAGNVRRFARQSDGTIAESVEGTPRLARDDKGDPIQGYEPARNAWPADAVVHIRGRLRTDDESRVREMVLQHQLKGSGTDPEATELTAHMTAVSAPEAWCALFIDRVDSPVSRVFEDESTCTVAQSPGTVEIDGDTIPYEAGDPIPGTGRIITVPPADDIPGRLAFVANLPPPVTAYVYSEIVRRANDNPLPGTRPVPSTSAERGPVSTSRSKVSAKKG